MSDQKHPGIVIVGGGECAARAAVSVRQRGFGGKIVLVGDELDAPYERPPLSKPALLAASDPQPVSVLPSALAIEHDVELALGVRAVAIDRGKRLVQLASGRLIAYDRLLLATGARARVLPIPGGDLAHTIRTIADARSLHAKLRDGGHVVVIGAGFIGLEVAASARQRGCHVTVLEVATQAMGRAVPADVAEVIVKRHIAEGVDIRFGVVVRSIALNGATLAVDIDGMAGPLHAEIVVAGVGALPNCELAAAAGLSIDDGIAVDDQLRTSDPGVFAAGDCCSAPHHLFGGTRIRLESWRNAHDQALVAAANLLGGHETNTAVPWFWSDQYDLSLYIAGLPQFAATEIVRERSDGSAARFGLDSVGRLVSAAGVAAGATMAKTMRIAEKIIAARATPEPAALANPDIPLKSLIPS